MDIEQLRKFIALGQRMQRDLDAILCPACKGSGHLPDGTGCDLCGQHEDDYWDGPPFEPDEWAEGDQAMTDAPRQPFVGDGRPFFPSG